LTRNFRLASPNSELLDRRASFPVTTVRRAIRQDGFNRTLLLSDLPNYSNILLLQGPVGPFFSKLGHYWRNRGAKVTKVNFNSGDDFFYPASSNEVIQYKARLDFWPKYLSNLLVKNHIKAVFLFGDCREVHQSARSICDAFGIDLIVFEEGYIRPNLFTMEKNGVNHFSCITKHHFEHIRQAPEAQCEPIIRNKYPNSYWYMVRWGIAYWFINLINQSHYPDYTHHRILDARMGWNWKKSFFQYWLYRVIDKSKRDRLLKNPSGAHHHGRLFLLPLQVHDDSQMVIHSDFQAIEDVAETVISSFAQHSLCGSGSDVLVIKHHPMDRGHKNYAQYIKKLAKLHAIQDRIVYIHDIAVPELLKRCDGCVTVNSTIGLQSLAYGVPTINLGRSFYDKPGLTFQGTLDEFWLNAGEVNRNNIKAFRNYLLHHTQVNGSLYDPAYQIK